MTPFRQLIRHGDAGLDVLAVKRALRVLGLSAGLTLGIRAGDVFELRLRYLQRAHGLYPDGIYGRATHRIVAPRFDRYGEQLYRRARLRRSHALAGYANPFVDAQIQPGRIDMGVDYHGYGPIHAIGDAYIMGNGGGGWPGGEYLLYRLRTGEHAGRYVYIAEAIIPLVRGGQAVVAGQSIARFRWDAAPGRYPGIETGWGTETLNLTYAAAMGNTGGPGHSDSPAGLAYARFLRQLGVPLGGDPGVGVTFPL